MKIIPSVWIEFIIAALLRLFEKIKIAMCTAYSHIFISSSSATDQFCFSYGPVLLQLRTSFALVITSLRTASWSRLRFSQPQIRKLKIIPRSFAVMIFLSLLSTFRVICNSCSVCGRTSNSWWWSFVCLDIIHYY